MDRFKKALIEFPPCLIGSTGIKNTVEDLVYIAETEIDLYDEGEENELNTLEKLKQVKKFIAKYKGK